MRPPPAAGRGRRLRWRRWRWRCSPETAPRTSPWRDSTQVAIQRINTGSSGTFCELTGLMRKRCMSENGALSGADIAKVPKPLGSCTGALLILKHRVTDCTDCSPACAVHRYAPGARPQRPQHCPRARAHQHHAAVPAVRNEIVGRQYGTHVAAVPARRCGSGSTHVHSGHSGTYQLRSMASTGCRPSGHDDGSWTRGQAGGRTGRAASCDFLTQGGGCRVRTQAGSVRQRGVGGMQRARIRWRGRHTSLPHAEP